MIDVRALEEGDDFNKLKKSFVMFITNYDPFRKKRYLYTFRSRCDEEMELLLNDAAAKLVVNTKGFVGEISPELKTLIRYLDSGETGDEYTGKLENEVSSIRADEKWRQDYITLAQKYVERESIGDHRRVVRQIRKNMGKFELSDLADVIIIPMDDCKQIIELIKTHHSWTDDEVADHVMWEEWK